MNVFDDIPFLTKPYERRRIHAARRKIRMQAAKSKGDRTKEQWISMLERFNNCCVKCGGDGVIQKDHIIPIYKGGSNSIDNLQPLCISCNTAKGSDQTDYRKDFYETIY